MAKFAGYGFNKSHSAAYALICYQTAYLKAHYPAQFMAALLSCDMNNTDKIVLYINECREHKLEVLPPDINESYYDFNVTDDRIRFGMAAVKNVGESALESIIQERADSGRYTSLENFCNRIDSRRVNSRVIESLIKAGAFDSLGCKRSQFFAILPQAMEQAKAAQRDRQSGQMSLFSLAPVTTTQELNAITLPDIAEWNELERLAFEKETVGFYITGHPLDDAIHEIRTVVDIEIGKLSQWGDAQPVRVGGLIRTCKQLKSKKGDPMAFLALEDILDSVEVVVFPEVYARSQHLLSSTEPVIIQGTVQKDERGAKIIAESIDPLAEALEKYTESINLKLDASTVTRQRLEALKKICYQFHGQCPLLLTIHFPGHGEVDIEILKDLTIRPCREFSEKMNETLGYPALSFKKKPMLAQVRKKWAKKNDISA
jgi:DNA polymerase-3 subunit alpha